MIGNNKYIIAITGPSGAGKTTLGDLLVARHNIAVPYHCTTRDRRSDDKDGFYRYLSHEEYSELLEQGKFLLSSGDGPVVSKQYGNFYGVLKEDCLKAFEQSNIVILFVSYKDIEQLIELKKDGMNIEIIGVTFSDIRKGVEARLLADHTRNHTQNDIDRRIKIAISDNEKYREQLEQHAKTIVFTDVLNIEETYEKVSKELKLKK